VTHNRAHTSNNLPLTQHLIWKKLSQICQHIWTFDR